MFSDIDDKWYVIWQSLFTFVSIEHFPIRRKRVRKSTYPWLDKSILVMIRRRDKYHKKARKFNPSSDWTEYRRLRSLVTSLIRKVRKTYFINKLQDCKSNPRSFWKAISLILPNRNDKSSISSLIVDKKELTSDDKDIANAMNAYFTSIATTLLANRHNLVSETPPEPVSSYIVAFNFSLRYKHEVFRALKELDQSKATGCDGISAKALKLAAPDISHSISHLSNGSLLTGQFPSVW